MDRPTITIKMPELDADLSDLFNAGMRTDALLMQIVRLLKAGQSPSPPAPAVIVNPTVNPPAPEPTA